ncbi:MAG: tetratricopeptide repeat protein [Pseudomonadota bacterium]|nr:tetratricopeptide repeat protein [Pseudomonadota bacterium]
MTTPPDRPACANRAPARNLLARALLACALLAAAGTPAWARDPVVETVRAALQQPKAETAVSAGERAVAARPKDAEAWYYAGQAFGKMAMQAPMLRKPGWATRTRDAFQAAVRLDPTHLGAREGLVMFYGMAPGFMGGGKDKAAAEIAAFARLNPAGGHYLRASGLQGAAAEKELRAAVRLAPEEGMFRRALAGRLEQDKRLDESLAVIREGLARAPSDAYLLYSLGRHTAVHGGDAQAGITALSSVIGKGSSLPDGVSMAGAYWRRGQLLEKQGKAGEAMADYRRAKTLAPGMEDIDQDIARLAAARG